MAGPQQRPDLEKLYQSKNPPDGGVLSAPNVHLLSHLYAVRSGYTPARLCRPIPRRGAAVESSMNQKGSPQWRGRLLGSPLSAIGPRSRWGEPQLPHRTWSGSTASARRVASLVATSIGWENGARCLCEVEVAHCQSVHLNKIGPILTSACSGAREGRCYTSTRTSGLRR